jgi:hypothetical protein
VADPELTLARALGADRPRPWWVLRPRVALAGLRALARGERARLARGDDALQLGADVVVDRDGGIALLHLAGDAADRVTPAELLTAVRALAATG